MRTRLGGVRSPGAAIAASPWLANNGIVGPILPLSSQTKQISDGDLETEIGGVGRVDEVDDMARALEAFREKGRARQSAEQQMAEERRNDETERRELERRVLEGEREVVSRREIPRASHA